MGTVTVETSKYVGKIDNYVEYETWNEKMNDKLKRWPRFLSISGRDGILEERKERKEWL